MPKLVFGDGLSQHELAEKCGLDKAHISLFETAKRQPKLVHLVRLARALQVPLQWFLTGSLKPGKDAEDIALELFHLGVVDLWIGNARVPGAFRPSEQVVALSVRGPRPEPRLRFWGLVLTSALNESPERIGLRYACDEGPNCGDLLRRFCTVSRSMILGPFLGRRKMN